MAAHIEKQDEEHNGRVNENREKERILYLDERLANKGIILWRCGASGFHVLIVWVTVLAVNLIISYFYVMRASVSVRVCALVSDVYTHTLA